MNWSAFSVGAIDGGEEGDDLPAILAGDKGWSIVEASLEEVADLQGMVVGRGVDGFEGGSVLELEGRELVFLAGDGPEVVERGARRSRKRRQ